MAKLTLDLSGRGGLAPKFFGDVNRTTAAPELRYIGNDNQFASGIFNPFRKLGYLSPPNNSFTTVATTNSIIYGSCIYDEINDDTYFAERGRVIDKGDTLDDLFMSQAVQLNSGSVLTDLEIYQVNSVRKLFYAYKLSGNLDIGIATLPFASNNNTWLSGTVTGSAGTYATAVNPFMRKADNGFMYVFQDNVVHKIDGTASGGTNGTITNNVLSFPVFFQLNDALDYKGKMFITMLQRTTDLSTTDSVNFNSDCGVYVWDRQTTVANMADYIPLTGVKEIRKIYVSPLGTVRMICVASNRLVQIREFDGSKFQVIQELGLLAYPAFSDSLMVANTMTFWLGLDGYFYGHGSTSYFEKEGLYRLAYTTTGNGVILYGGGASFSGSSDFRTDFEAFYLSISTTSFKKWFFNAGLLVDAAGQTAGQGDVYTLVKYLPKLSTVNFIRIFGSPSSVSDGVTSATVKIYLNQSATPWASKIVTRADWSRGYVDIAVNKPYINAIQMEFEWNTSVLIGASEFSPSYAEIDYTPTETNK